MPDTCRFWILSRFALAGLLKVSVRGVDGLVLPTMLPVDAIEVFGIRADGSVGAPVSVDAWARLTNVVWSCDAARASIAAGLRQDLYSVEVSLKLYSAARVPTEFVSLVEYGRGLVPLFSAEPASWSLFAEDLFSACVAIGVLEPTERRRVLLAVAHCWPISSDDTLNHRLDEAARRFLGE